MRKPAGLLKIYQNNETVCIKMILINQSFYNKIEKPLNLDSEEEKWEEYKENISILDASDLGVHQFWTITKRRNKEVMVQCDTSNKVNDNVDKFFAQQVENMNILFSVSGVSSFCTSEKTKQHYKKIQEEEPTFLSSRSLVSIIVDLFINITNLYPKKSNDVDEDNFWAVPKNIKNRSDSIEWLMNTLVFLKINSKKEKEISPNFYNTSYEKIIIKKDGKVIVDLLGMLFGLVLIFSPLFKFNIQNYYLKISIHSLVFIGGWILLAIFLKEFFKDNETQEELKAIVDKNLLEVAEQINGPAKKLELGNVPKVF